MSDTGERGTPERRCPECGRVAMSSVVAGHFCPVGRTFVRYESDLSASREADLG